MNRLLWLIMILAIVTPGGNALCQTDQPPRSTDISLPKPTTAVELERLRRSGYEGAVDPAALRIRDRNQVDKRDEPTSGSQLSAAGDENWWDGFGGTAIHYRVRCIAIYNGDLIIGGQFQNAGGVPGTEKIARWDGSNWTSMNANFISTVRALEVYQGELYAGGDFLKGGGAVASYLARWNGSIWRSVSTQPSGGTVSALFVSGGFLYAGGSFTSIGGISASRVARWNGTSWSALGSGFNSTCLAFASYQGNLIASGSFVQSGTTVLNRIGRWTGSSWEPLGSGFSGSVYALAASDSFLFAGGYFTVANGSPGNHIARWNGSNWGPVGSGMNEQVNALAFIGSDLWAGGYFTAAGGIGANSLARWDGTSWNAFGNGLVLENGPGDVETILAAGDSAYVGGFFYNADGVEAINLTGWSNGNWFAPMASSGTGAAGDIWDIISFQGGLIMGGAFLRAGGQDIDHIARWDGTNWQRMGDPNGQIYSFTIYDDHLIAAGAFTTIGGVAANFVARWDGVAWEPIGSGMNDYVGGVAVLGGELYAVGAFSMADGMPASRVARWDGVSWHALGTGLTGGYFPDTWALAEYGGSIYVGGQFTSAGGVAGTAAIARWDGTNWYSVGGGVQGIDNGGQPYETIVYDFANYDGKLAVGGDFTRAAGLVTKFVATWDGTNWAALGGGTGAQVHALSVYGQDLVAGGWVRPDGQPRPLDFIAKWDGASFLPMGSGMDNWVNALRVIGGSLFVGGQFETAGDKSSLGIARWTDLAVASVQESPKRQFTLPYPNPFQGAVRIQFEARLVGQHQVDVFDLKGRRIRELVSGELEAGPQEFAWDGRDDQGRETPGGVYFLRVEGPAGTESFKVVRQR